MILFNLFVIEEMWLKLGAAVTKPQQRGFMLAPTPTLPPGEGVKFYFGDLRSPNPSPGAEPLDPTPSGFLIGILKVKALKFLLGYAVPTFSLWVPKGTPLVKVSGDRRSPESNDHALSFRGGSGWAYNCGCCAPNPATYTPFEGATHRNKGTVTQ